MSARPRTFEHLTYSWSPVTLRGKGSNGMQARFLQWKKLHFEWQVLVTFCGKNRCRTAAILSGWAIMFRVLAIANWIRSYLGAHRAAREELGSLFRRFCCGVDIAGQPWTLWNSLHSAALRTTSPRFVGGLGHILHRNLRKWCSRLLVWRACP